MSDRYGIVETPTEIQIILKKPEYSFTQEEIKKLREEYEGKGYVFAGKTIFLGGLEGLVFKKVQVQPQPKTQTQISIPQEVKSRPDIVQLNKQYQQIQQEIQKVEQIERRMVLFEDVKQKAQNLISEYQQALEKYKDVKSEEDLAKLAGYFSRLSSDIRLFISKELVADYPEIVSLKNYLQSISVQSANLAHSLLQQRDKVLSGQYEIDKEKAKEFVEETRSLLFQVYQDISSVKTNITKEEIVQIKSDLYKAKELIETELQQRAQVQFQPTKEEYMKAFQILKDIYELKNILNNPKYKQNLTLEKELEIWKEIKKKEGELAELYLFYPEMQKVIPEMEKYFENIFAKIGYGIQAVLGKHFWEYPVKFFTEGKEGVGKKFEESLVETIVTRSLKPVTTIEGILEANKEFFIEGAGSLGIGYLAGAKVGALVGTAISKGQTLFSKIGEILKPVSSKIEPFIEPIATNVKFYGSKVLHGFEKIGEKIGALIPQPLKDFGEKVGSFIGKGFVKTVTNPYVVFVGTEATIRGIEAGTRLASGENPKEVGEKIASEVLRDVATFYTFSKGFDQALQHFGTKKADVYLLAKSKGMSDVEMAEYLKSLKSAEKLFEKLKGVEEYKIYEIETPSGVAKISTISKEKPVVLKDVVAKEEIPVEKIIQKGKVLKEEYPFKLIEYKGEHYLFSSVPPKKVVESDLIDLLKIGKEYEKGISLKLLTQDFKGFSLFRVKAEKSLYLPIAEEEEKIGTRFLPKRKYEKDNLLKELAEYYKKQLEKEAEEKAKEEALRRAKELEKTLSTAEGKTTSESVLKSEEKFLEKEISKMSENIAGVRYTYYIKPPQMKIPMLPLSELKFDIEQIKENVKKDFVPSISFSVLSKNLNFISKIESSLSNMLKEMQITRLSRDQKKELDLSQITKQSEIPLRTPKLIPNQILTPKQREETFKPPITFTITKPPKIPFRPISTRIKPPNIPKISFKLPTKQTIKNELKSFEKMFGFAKAKYTPSLFGLLFNIKTKVLVKFSRVSKLEE